MSTVGLRKDGNFESALAAALRDEQHIDGVISPYLQREATKIINNPLFQRVKDRLEDDLIQQEKTHAQQKNFETHVTNLAVDARINRNDLDYIVNNLQQPPPPPVPPTPQTDAAADRARLVAELDGMAQERERRLRQEMLAAENARSLRAQQVQTPAQQIVNHYHAPANPQPVFVQPDMSSASEMMRQMGMTFQQLFLARQQEDRRRDEIPITYTSSGGSPPGPPGSGAIVASSYGPAKLPKSRSTPFSSGGPPPAPGGATAPMPIAMQQVTRRRDLGPQRPPAPPPDPPAPPAPARKRKGDDVAVNSKGPRVPRFPGQGQKLPEPKQFVAFSGQAQRLPDENLLRANAIQRMQDLAERQKQARRGREMIDRRMDLGRAIRRGGERGDVVGPGRRKREDENRDPNLRRRILDREPGPQRFTMQ